MPTLALYGGSFDPPHVGHQLLALYALETRAIDGIVVMPSARHAFGKGIAAYDHRLALARLAFAALGDRVEVSDLESRMTKERVFTLDTLDALARERPDVSWRLLVGADILEETVRWHQWDEVVRRAPLIVVQRGTGDLAIPDVSSTEIRALLAEDHDASRLGDLLPATVLAYIREHQLYRNR